MSKKITVPPKPQLGNRPLDPADWIARPEVPSAPNGEVSEKVAASEEESGKEPQVRLTFDIPESLHRRMKIYCANRGIKRMSVELRRVLEQHFTER
jgi:hypothetical protein